MKIARVLLLALIGVGIFVAWQLSTFPRPHTAKEVQRMEGIINAPEFPEGLEWLNTDRPLRLRDLRGKVVLLDFWTYCCINCMHILPDLKKLERKYADSLVVIGVHSAKFFTEQETENIRQAILRYDIEHPVVNDSQMVVWTLYGARAWPTLVLIDPEGKIVGYHAGEGAYRVFDPMIARVIQAAEAKGTLRRGALNFALERDKEARTVLRFPGKVLADERTQRLFIADSGHHRIIVASLKDGTVQTVIGSGEMGFQDGSFAQARFNNPQGMAYDAEADVLYIADTDNHAIRKADLRTRTVETLAGTGEQSHYYPPRPGKGRETALNSPWDVVLVGETLFIAMAGSHQLWRLNLKTLEVQPHAGTGREARIDGPLRGSALAQPSGITTDGKKLYFADSEVSCIRAADIDPDGILETLVGGDLFEFGDKDGVGSQARLQHPLGVVYVDGVLYVADTYNNKIKRLDLRTRRIETFLGTGAAGARDGDNPTFDEPGGISYANSKLYIADTNNHLIRVADLKTKRVETLQLRGLEAAKPPALHRQPSRQTLEPIEVGTETPTLSLRVRLPEGHKLNPSAQSQVRVVAQRATVQGKAETVLPLRALDTPIPVQLAAEHATLDLHLLVYHCRVGQEGLCYFYEAQLSVPLVRAGNAQQATVEVAVSR
ncbi:MAG: thioredoxin-like domain-containing protein [Fimbriimonadales bacterium]|nr:thioredoxin-like domain-containing protein [Fimbriimonadales bacterium]MDW8052284.1 thioredoxin-like domain-containing protein [Armatimonadota bacterium]